MITGAQVRAGRALIGLDQRALAELAGLSLPTIQRMEKSPDSVRVVVDSLERVLRAFAAVGVELIPDSSPSAGRGRGVRMIQPPNESHAADKPQRTVTAEAACAAQASLPRSGPGHSGGVAP